MSIRGSVLFGFRKTTVSVPAFVVNREMEKAVRRIRMKVKGFTAKKRKVHHFVVRELPGRGGPISINDVAHGLGMPLRRVEALIDELEKEKTFLYRRNSAGINWAYPVTVEATPHKITFSTGECVNAA
jgi:hypothetical protein